MIAMEVDSTPHIHGSWSYREEGVKISNCIAVYIVRLMMVQDAESHDT